MCPLLQRATAKVDCLVKVLWIRDWQGFLIGHLQNCPSRPKKNDRRCDNRKNLKSGDEPGSWNAAIRIWHCHCNHTHSSYGYLHKAMPFLVIMDGGPIPFQGAEGKSIIFSSGEANRGTGRRGSQAKEGGHKQVVVWAYHTQHTTHVWNCQADNEGQLALHVFQVVRPLWEHSSRAKLHLWGLRGVISRARRTQLWIIGLVRPLKTDFPEAKSALPRSGWSCWLSLCGSVPRVHPLLSLTWGGWCSLWVGKGTWRLRVNIMYMERMGSAAMQSKATPLS